MAPKPVVDAKRVTAPEHAGSTPAEMESRHLNASCEETRRYSEPTINSEERREFNPSRHRRGNDATTIRNASAHDIRIVAPRVHRSNEEDHQADCSRRSRHTDQHKTSRELVPNATVKGLGRSAFRPKGRAHCWRPSRATCNALDASPGPLERFVRHLVSD